MNNIVKETLDARYTIPAAPLDNVWLNGALREVLDRLEQAGCTVRRTDQEGTIIIRR